MMTDRAQRTHAPPGSAAMANYRRGGAPPGASSGGTGRGGAGDQGTDGALRQLTLRRLLNLIEHAGELPPTGSPGVLLPPITPRFLGDELGCRPAQAEEVLSSLVEEGLLVLEAGRYRAPLPKALLRSGFS